MLIKELKVSRNGFTMGGNHILQFQGPFSLKSIKSNLVFFTLNLIQSFLFMIIGKCIITGNIV